MRPKDNVDPKKQDGVVYKIPCECGKVCIGETGRYMFDWIKDEHDRDRFKHNHPLFQNIVMRPGTVHSGTSKLSSLIETYIGTLVELEAIHIRLHPDNINRDIELKF